MAQADFALPKDGNQQGVQALRGGGVCTGLAGGTLEFINETSKQQMYRIAAQADSYYKTGKDVDDLTVATSGSDVGHPLPSGAFEYIPLPAGYGIKINSSGDVVIGVAQGC